MSVETIQLVRANIRVGIVDEDVLFRAGAAQVVGDAHSMKLAFVVGALLEPWTHIGTADVMIIGNLNGQWPAVLASDGVAGRGTRFIMLIDDPTQGELTTYWDAGISLCLRRETDGRGLIKAIVRAHAMPGIDLTNRAPIPVEIEYSGHNRDFNIRNNYAGIKTLKSREMQMLNAIAKGFSNKTIASHYGISDQTVKKRLTGILRKLHATDRTEAVVIAFRRGWLDVAEFGMRVPLQTVLTDVPSNALDKHE